MGIRGGEYCADGIDASWRCGLGPQEWMAASFRLEMMGSVCVDLDTGKGAHQNRQDRLAER